MLDIKFIRKHPDIVKENCKNRLVNVDIDKLLDLDKKRRELATEIDLMRSKRKAGSKTKPSEKEIEELKNLNKEIKRLEDVQELVTKEYNELLFQVPNLTYDGVCVSDNEEDNPVIGAYKEPTKFNFKPRDHVEIAKNLDLIDFVRATKVTGAKFYYLKNELALMEVALIQYALEKVMEYGYTPFITPDLAKQEVLRGLGFNPRGESTQIYNIENTDLSLIGTAEITLGGYHKDEILDEKELPKKYVALSHCFRTEAGSYSKFSKGIFRVHQFTKIEMFQYTTPAQSVEAHNEMLLIEKRIFEGLDIPFRVIDHCTADLGAPAARTYDLEAWMPGKPNKQGKLGDWAEITSTSNCTDYQARGLNIKYKDEFGKKNFVHTLNGTAIAVSRALIAILENYQQKDGSVVVPKVLRKYMPGGIKVIKRK
jgi:seryl-tRNA synthetase